VLSLNLLVSHGLSGLMDELAGTLPHEDLHVLRRRLQYIHKTMADWEPLGLNNLPILDSSIVGESSEDIDWLQPQHVPGFRSLREAIQRDICALDKVNFVPAC
jgi:hypothetical protein